MLYVASRRQSLTIFQTNFRDKNELSRDIAFLCCYVNGTNHSEWILCVRVCVCVCERERERERASEQEKEVDLGKIMSSVQSLCHVQLFVTVVIINTY